MSPYPSCFLPPLATTRCPLLGKPIKSGAPTPSNASYLGFWLFSAAPVFFQASICGGAGASSIDPLLVGGSATAVGYLNAAFKKGPHKPLVEVPLLSHLDFSGSVSADCGSRRRRPAF